MTPPRSMLRRSLSAAATATLLLALSACGDNANSDDESSSNDTNSSTETATEDAPTEAVPTETTPAPGANVPLDDVTLEGALLTQADMPAGFALDTNDDDAADDSSLEGTCFVDFEDIADDSLGDASQDFSQASADGSAAASIETSLESYADAAQLQAWLDDYVNQLATCPSANGTDDELTFELRIIEGPVDILGAEQQFSFTAAGTVTTNGTTLPVSTTLMGARLGNNVASVITTMLGDDASLVVHPEEQNAITQAQFDKLADLVG